MSRPPQILAFAGSTRRASWNKKLVQIAAAAARQAGAEVTYIDLAAYALPMYDGDLEEREGIPGPALRLKVLMKDHDGFLIASPEYNSSITGVLKNTIDWASRTEQGEPPRACFVDKVVTLMSASPGGLGGLRGLVHVRAILQNLGCIVLPAQVAIPSAIQAFDKGGMLLDERQQAKVEELGRGLVDFLKRLAPRA